MRKISGRQRNRQSVIVTTGAAFAIAAVALEVCSIIAYDHIDSYASDSCAPLTTFPVHLAFVATALAGLSSLAFMLTAFVAARRARSRLHTLGASAAAVLGFGGIAFSVVLAALVDFARTPWC